MPSALAPRSLPLVLSCALLAVYAQLASAHEGLPGAAVAADGDGGEAAPPVPVSEPFQPRVLRPAAPATMAPQLGGQWSSVVDWPLVAIHAALLPTGNVLAWDATPDDSDDDPHTTDNYTTRVTLWDPIAGTHTATNNDTDTDLFCAGSAHLWDGRILFAGGDGAREGANGPLANSNIYDPTTNTWRRTENMHAPRWYSSVAALPNGEMLTFSGNYSPDPIAEVFDLDRTWRALPLDTGGRDWMDDYQWIQATPEGSVLAFGPQNLLAEIDTAGAGQFTEISPRDEVDYRSYGSYAMYDVGKILVAGGGESVDTAVIIDTATRQVSDGGTMNTGRRQHNLTILADGSVLVTGGNDDGTKNISLTGGVFTPELWDPDTASFSELNPMNADRQYHSIALLLQDGRVLSAGGGICGDCYAVGYEERNGAVFSPPYLFGPDGQLAERPRLGDVRAQADYGERLEATVSGGAALVRAHLIKLGSTTHSENQDQRLVPLTMSLTEGRLSVTLPAERDVAPPGHYLLIGVDANGVPSPGVMIKLGQPLLGIGEPVTSTLEPNAWDHYLLPFDGEIEVQVMADAPIELYAATDQATGPGRLEQASCRAAVVGSDVQSCTVGSDGQEQRWYLSVHGAQRTDYRLTSRATGRDTSTDATTQPGGSSDGTPGETAGGASDGADGGASDGADDGASDEAGDGAGDPPRGDAVSPGATTDGRVKTGGGGAGPGVVLLASLAAWRSRRRRVEHGCRSGSSGPR